MPDTDALHRGDFMEPRYTLVNQQLVRTALNGVLLDFNSRQLAEGSWRKSTIVTILSLPQPCDRDGSFVSSNQATLDIDSFDPPACIPELLASANNLLFSSFSYGLAPSLG